MPLEKPTRHTPGRGCTFYIDRDELYQKWLRCSCGWGCRMDHLWMLDAPPLTE